MKVVRRLYLLAVGLMMGLVFISFAQGSESSQEMGVSAAGADTTTNRPNILFIMTDDQFPGTELRMPHFKGEMKSQGVTFSNTVSTFPLCCPGRATIHTGLYPHNTHVYGNTLPLGGYQKFARQGLQKKTFAVWLDRAGYETGHFGKYLNDYKGKSNTLPGWDRWYTLNGGLMGYKSVNDQGTTTNMSAQRADIATSSEALEFIRNNVGKDQPFMAMADFVAMHSPYPHDKTDNDLFRNASVPRTMAFNEKNVSDKPAYIRSDPRLGPKARHHIDADYRNGLRSLMRVDRFLDDAVDTLRANGELSNTYIVFYTDNGNHFGQHRQKPGKLMPYEEDINFPLYIRGPGIAHGVTKPQLVGNHDIAPTLARMGSANAPTVDGRSILALAKGDVNRWPRDAILSMKKGANGGVTDWWAVRHMNSIYIKYKTGEKEYYSLSKDPHEINNKAGRLGRRAKARFGHEIDRILGCKDLGCRRAENR